MGGYQQPQLADSSKRKHANISANTGKYYSNSPESCATKHLATVLDTSLQPCTTPTPTSFNPDSDANELKNLIQFGWEPVICPPILRDTTWYGPAGACFGVHVADVAGGHSRKQEAGSGGRLRGESEPWGKGPEARVSVVLVMGPGYDALAMGER